MGQRKIGLVLAAWLWVAGSVGVAQEPSAALRDRVNQLVEKLAGDDAAQRAEAEADLTALGARILSLLPDASAVGEGAQRESLERVVAALKEAGQKVNLGGSKVTLQGEGVRLSDALVQLQRQTGNMVTDLREQYGQEVSNPALELDLVDVPFFEALDVLCEKAELEPTFFTGDGTIGLMAGGGMYPEGDPMPGKVPAERLVVYSGPFRIQWMETTLRRNFAAGQSAANVRLEVAWEPRLSPMVLDLKADRLEITDDRGEAIAPQVEEETSSVALNTANPMAEINLNLSNPDRAAKAIGRLAVKGDVTLPAGFHSFRFASLEKPEKQTAEGMTVELVSMEVDDFVWKARLLISGGVENAETLDSYQQGMINNRIWLQRGDGSRFEQNGGFSSLGGSAGKVGFEYLFVDAPGKPGDYGLIYETPSNLTTIPLEFEFKDVRLP